MSAISRRLSHRNEEAGVNDFTAICRKKNSSTTLIVQLWNERTPRNRNIDAIKRFVSRPEIITVSGCYDYSQLNSLYLDETLPDPKQTQSEFHFVSFSPTDRFSKHADASRHMGFGVILVYTRSLRVGIIRAWPTAPDKERFRQRKTFTPSLL